MKHNPVMGSGLVEQHQEATDMIRPDTTSAHLVAECTQYWIMMKAIKGSICRGMLMSMSRLTASIFI